MHTSKNSVVTCIRLSRATRRKSVEYDIQVLELVPPLILDADGHRGLRRVLKARPSCGVGNNLIIIHIFNEYANESLACSSRGLRFSSLCITLVHSLNLVRFGRNFVCGIPACKRFVYELLNEVDL